MEKDVQSSAEPKRSNSTPAVRPEPPALGEEFFRNTDVSLPKKRIITIRLDADVLDWLKRQGKGYQTRINKLLRSYMKASTQNSG
ncbi:MAG TPA: BrnA antitoxin family protein [Gammaproteobacteria bacterium]|nr:BrnA antitoxin family protein [Gammaproteobacteria bacterium]